MNGRHLWFALLTACLVAAPAQATKLYKWVDKDGNVSYHDRPPPEGSGVKSEEKDVGTRNRYRAEDDDGAKRAPVVLYVVPKCAPCDQARAYLERRKVPVTIKNISTDEAAAAELKQKVGDFSVPTITVGARVMKGYMETLLEGELDQAGYPKLPAEKQEKPAGNASQ
jgi:glutaredoxin